MTDKTRNEAAERLRDRFQSNAWDVIADQFEEALATERRLTVEPVRELTEQAMQITAHRPALLRDDPAYRLAERISALLDELGEQRP